MTRPVDEEIPADEWLYRRVTEENLDGPGLLEAAIDVPGCSVNRAAYSGPADVFDHSRPAFNRVARVRAGSMPNPLVRDDGVTLLWEPDDDPLENNPAHAEVRLKRQQGDNAPTYNPNWNGGARGEEMRTRLAGRFSAMDQPRLDPPAAANPGHSEAD